jgi:transposase
MSNFTLSLDIDSLKITAQSIDTQGNIIFDVESTRTETACHKCGQLTNKRYGLGETITIRHLPILDTPVYLRICVVRYECHDCNDRPTTSEQYDWMERKSKTTKGLDRYINRQLIHSTIEDVGKKINISSEVVESALNRGIDIVADWSAYNNLETIGIDEIAVRKGHNNYLTIVSVKDKLGELSVLAVLPDRLKETVKTFLESIPEHLRKTVKSVCTDMHEGFVNSAEEVFGKRCIVIDRYHVSKLYREPLDRIRIAEMKRLKATLTLEEYTKLEGMMWILRKKHECLSSQDKIALELMYKHSLLLKVAHQMALKLTQIFNTHHNRKIALSKINRWIKSVQNSDLTCFDGFIKTLEKYKVNILNYFKSRKNSGFVEGLNNKIKVLKRRCYGLSKPESFFQRLFLDLRGYKAFA